MFGRFVEYKGLKIYVVADRQHRGTGFFRNVGGKREEILVYRDMNRIEYEREAKAIFESGWLKKMELAELPI